MTPGGGASAILRAVEGHEWRSGARAPAGERLAQKTEEVEQSPSNHSCDWIGSHAINQTAKRRDQWVSGSRLKTFFAP
jgi:hypothetical protein